jgi:serine/threonine-protein kinase
MVGQLLGNRYEILEEIGRGGMAYVYRAKCTLLNRIVAVKILQPQFAGDEEFVRRFRRESQAAASLSHPNIVSIFDVGQEGDLHYIVMEYVKGRTLKEKIRDEAPLPISECLNLSTQIGLALDHAHLNEIVHCDIKPHNILLTRDGRIKVTDFGLARAVSTATLTYTESVIGSVHYFSPEQAKGMQATKKSDLYSAGIVLYEMLTGRLPFQGESPITIALQHIQNTPESPQVYRNDIPTGLIEIVMHSIEKEPESRYGSAAEWVRVLKDFAGNPEHMLPGNAVFDEYDTQTVPIPVVTETDDLKKGGWSHWLRENRKKAMIGVVVLALTFAALGFAVMKIKDILAVPTVEAPDITGKSLAVATDELGDLKLTIRIVGEVYSDLLANYIVSQDPNPGESMKITLPISVIVSKGPEMVTILNVIGMKQEDAELNLVSGDLVVGTISEIYHATIAKGYVIDQNPRPDIAEVKKGSAVNLVVSMGPQPVAMSMPDLVGKYLNTALSTIMGMKLIEGRIIEDPASPYPHGMVVRQSPAIGSSIAEGDKVDLTVSTRPDIVVSEPVNNRTISIDVPSSGPASQEIRVDLMDINRYRTVDISMRAPGDSYELDVEWIGEKALIKIYINGIFRESREID